VQTRESRLVVKLTWHGADILMARPARVFTIRRWPGCRSGTIRPVRLPARPSRLNLDPVGLRAAGSDRPICPVREPLETRVVRPERPCGSHRRDRLPPQGCRPGALNVEGRWCLRSGINPKRLPSRTGTSDAAPRGGPRLFKWDIHPLPPVHRRGGTAPHCIRLRRCAPDRPRILPLTTLPDSPTRSQAIGKSARVPDLNHRLRGL
jgi:hypothetical protein